jgi:Ca-activated chloride channel family protein
MACKEQGQKVTDYHFGELDGPERQKMEAHLRECADCRAELELLQKTTAFVKEACLSSAADLPALSADRRDELRQAAKKRQVAMEKAQKPQQGWFGGLFSLRNSAWAFSLSCACIVMIAVFTSTGGEVQSLLGTVSGTLNEDGTRATDRELQRASAEEYKPAPKTLAKGPQRPEPAKAPHAPEPPLTAAQPAPDENRPDKSGRRASFMPGNEPARITLSKKRPTSVSLASPTRPVARKPLRRPTPKPTFGAIREYARRAQESLAYSTSRSRRTYGKGGSAYDGKEYERKRDGYSVAGASMAKPKVKDVVVKQLAPRTVSVTSLPADKPEETQAQPRYGRQAKAARGIGSKLMLGGAMSDGPSDGAGGSAGDDGNFSDSFSFDEGAMSGPVPTPVPTAMPAPPPPVEKSGDIDSRRKMFEAMAGEKKKAEAPLQELATGYVDKMTKMSVSEKENLKQSLQNYLVIDAEKILTETKKKEILEGESNAGNFSDRLSNFRAWHERLLAKGKNTGLPKAYDGYLQNLFFVNPNKAIRRLDRAIERLAALDGVVAEENVGEELKFISYGINPFVQTSKDKFSTFAMDCDTAAYTLGRTYLRRGQLPPWQSVRVEEYVNFFDYEYDTPEEGSFAIHGEAAPSPYRKNHLLLRVGIKAREVSKEQRRPARLTFVVDVSGSMSSQKRLPLVRRALKMLVDELREGDQVSIVVYGSRARLFLDWTEATRKQSIKNKIMRLRTQGSTNAEQGLVLGYRQAAKNFSNGCDNRVILCSDGVANVGKRGPEAILKEIKKYSDKGIYLTTVGFGRGNYSDVMMERLANKGNGTYAYVDNENEARRIFVEKLTGTLVTVGKDAKIQVEFSEKAVKSYRLLGYENRDVKDEDFRNDKVDAGEVGAGHSVTALYELELSDDLGSSLGTVRVRYQSPRSSRVTEIQEVLDNKCIKASFDKASTTYRLAAVVGQLAEILRKSPYAKSRTIEELIPQVDELAKELRHDVQVQELKSLIHKVADR